MGLQEALTLVEAHKLGVLITTRRDGAPQSSNVVYAVSGRQLRISATEDPAKTCNLRGHPQAPARESTSAVSC